MLHRALLLRLDTLLVFCTALHPLDAVVELLGHTLPERKSYEPEHQNEETHRLAKELAELTGETMTGAITVAIRQRLERERRERDLDARVKEIQNYWAALRLVAH